jgi:hypothetical protein
MSQFTEPAAELSVQQRAYIALYALRLGTASRAAILASHRLTEADLQAHQPGWELLLAHHADSKRPMPRPEADYCRLVSRHTDVPSY